MDKKYRMELIISGKTYFNGKDIVLMESENIRPMVIHGNDVEELSLQLGKIRDQISIDDKKDNPESLCLCLSEHGDGIAVGSD